MRRRATDRNAWLFNLSSGRPVLVDSKNLVLDTRRAQAFDFDAILVPGSSGGTDFLAATEEGILWQGRIDRGRMTIDGTSKVSLDGAAAIACLALRGLRYLGRGFDKALQARVKIGQALQTGLALAPMTDVAKEAAASRSS